MRSQEVAEKIEIPEFPSKDFYVDLLRRNSLDGYNTALKEDLYLSLSSVLAFGFRLKKYDNKYIVSNEKYELLENVVNDLWGGHNDSFPETPLEEVEHLFQYIQHYPKEISNAYKEVTGTELEYKPWSPVLIFYKKWGSYPLWTLKQAICLVHGMCPDFTEVTRNHRDKPVRVAKNELFPFIEEQFDETYKLALVCIKARTLKEHNGIISIAFENNSDFYPIDIIKWAIDNGIKPHPLLLKFTGYNKEHAPTPQKEVPNINSDNPIPSQQFLNDANSTAKCNRWWN